jgi:hypothetical protein
MSPLLKYYLSFLIFFGLCFFNPILIYGQDLPADSTTKASYKVYNDLLNSEVVMKYYSKEDINKLFEQDKTKLIQLHTYFFKSFTISPIEGYAGIRPRDNSFDVFKFESYRKKNEVFISEDLFKGYKIELKSDEQIQNIVPAQIKQKALRNREIYDAKKRKEVD